MITTVSTPTQKHLKQNTPLEANKGKVTEDENHRLLLI